MRIFVQGNFFIALILSALLALPDVAQAFDWPVVSPEDLKMTREPEAPGASAIFLDRLVSRNYDKDEENVYERVKVLSEPGLKYANIEIPYIKYQENIHDFEARIVKQDGTVKKFSGKAIDEVVFKSHG